MACSSNWSFWCVCGVEIMEELTPSTSTSSDSSEKDADEQEEDLPLPAEKEGIDSDR